MTSLVLIQTGLEMPNSSKTHKSFTRRNFCRLSAPEFSATYWFWIPGLNSWQRCRFTYSKWLVGLKCASQRVTIQPPAKGVVTESGLQSELQKTDCIHMHRAQRRLEAQQRQGSKYQWLNYNVSPFSRRNMPKGGEWMKGLSQAKIQVKELRVDQRRPRL